MTVYAIGDVQGCYTSLLKLLDKIGFDEARDELWFCGDLVNRGPKSADVLRYVMNLRKSCAVLGNHDLHLLAVAEGFRKPKQSDTFDDILRASDRNELLSWLRGRPLAHFSRARRTLLVHAGLYPGWGLKEGLALAKEVEQLIAGEETYAELLRRMYGDTPPVDGADPFDRARWIINAFTRMRFCHREGGMDFNYFGAPGTQPADLVPWFHLREAEEFRIVFGHWSMLGVHQHLNTVGLDSGCVHGGQLTALNLSKKSNGFTQIKCVD